MGLTVQAITQPSPSSQPSLLQTYSQLKQVTVVTVVTIIKKVLPRPFALRVTQSPGVVLDTENIRGVAVFYLLRKES